MKRIIVLLIATVLTSAVSVWAYSEGQWTNEKHCACINKDCGCCEYLNFPEIRINGTVCTNFTYLSKDYGISVTATYNTYTFFNETVSARNPPPICFGIPEMDKIPAHACVRFYDLKFEPDDFHGCVKVIISIYHVIRKTINVGCFNIPRSVLDDAYATNNHKHVVSTSEEPKKLEYRRNDIPSVRMI